MVGFGRYQFIVLLSFLKMVQWWWKRYCWRDQLGRGVGHNHSGRRGDDGHSRHGHGGWLLGCPVVVLLWWSWL